MKPKTNPDLPFSKRPIFSPEELEEAKRQTAEDIKLLVDEEFKEYCEAQVNPRNISSNMYVFKQQIKNKISQKYLQNPQTKNREMVKYKEQGANPLISVDKTADNQERDSKMLFSTKSLSSESRPGVLKVSNAKELVETLKDNKNKDIVFIEEGCGKILGNFPFSDLTPVCGDGFDGETILCEDCRAKQKAQGDLR